MDKQYRSVELREQLKEVLEVDLLEGAYYFQKHNLVIESEITSAELNLRGTIFYIKFGTSLLILDEYTKITKLEKIPYLDKQFDWIFEIHNISNEHIGYIGKISQQTYFK